MAVTKTYINHIALVLDASSSMDRIAKQTVQVADFQIQHLADMSKRLDQETRITVYSFADKVKNICYDKDVLRLPSLKDDYSVYGYTALVDASLKAIEDLEKTATLYGDHAFLLYILTDGEENRSQKSNFEKLKMKLSVLPDNWTVAVLVPNSTGVFAAKGLGFKPNNIAVWDTSEQGMIEVGEKIRATTDSYMQARSQGVFRGTDNLFAMDTRNLTPNIVKTILTEVHPKVYPVAEDGPINQTVSRYLGNYKLGSAFYQITKPEDVQPQKKVLVREKATDKFFTGPSARDLIGLPDYQVRVKPADHPKYDIFIQSTSVNRKLLAGTEVAVL